MKENRFLNFVRANLYYIIAVALILLIVSIVAMVNGANSKGAEFVEDNTIKEVNAPAVTYTIPVENFSILKEYSDTDLMYNATLKRWEAHKALDLSASEGASVMAVASGRVAQVYSNYLEGTVVVIEHDNNMKSLYSSLAQDVNVKVGDMVNAGDVIGKVGNTANGEHTDGAHLHFEFYRDGIKVNPNEYIAFTEK